MWKMKNTLKYKQFICFLRLDREPEWPNRYLGGQWQGGDANHVGQVRSRSVPQTNIRILLLLYERYFRPDMVADFIPVDTCINLMVAVAWRTAVNHINPMPVRYAILHYTHV